MMAASRALLSRPYHPLNGSPYMMTTTIYEYESVAERRAGRLHFAQGHSWVARSYQDGINLDRDAGFLQACQHIGEFLDAHGIDRQGSTDVIDVQVAPLPAHLHQAFNRCR